MTKKLAIFDSSVDTPEEIILAADLIPMRLFGDPTITNENADAHIPPNHCVWSRNLLEQGIQGLDEDIVGLITTHGCDCTNRQFDIWFECVNKEFMFFLNAPLKRDKISRKFFIKDMKELITQLEDHFGIQITDKKLNENISLMNQIRRLLKEISEFRSKMVLKGSEFHNLVKKVQTIDKQEALQLLENTLNDLKDKTPSIDEGLKKILLTGSIIDDTEFIKTLENLGFQIIIDDLCVGTRYFWTLAEEDNDPLEAIADYHLNKPVYSTKFPSKERFTFIEELLDSYQVDGIINVAQKFCESVLYDHPFMNKKLKEIGIPYLFIEKEYNRESYKQLKTRFEAFGEII
ncbi:MAG: hypothetical protein GF317_07805 [Candidatus Lokiarchaeota archaeon]|nr:hypothetical protein [Candidatus Lokiarchaeota archaeon]MBD3199617.1 hypothetical protein [Candidatus Lokiarchaeota archaeon]